MSVTVLIRKLPYDHPYRWDGTKFGGVKLWTPDNMTTLAWYDTYDEDTITDSGGSVSQLDDKSGSGNHLTQISGSAQPTTGTRDMNGLNVLDCDGGDYMEKTSFPIPSSGDVAFFIVAEIDAIDNGSDSVFSVDASKDFQFDANNGSQFDGKLDVIGIGSGVSLTGGPFSGPSIYNANFDKTTAGVYNAFIDGIQRASDTTYSNSLDVSQTLRVFCNRSGSVSIDGAFGELIVCEDVTEETREKIEGYLAHKWGIEGNLPGGHTYKSSPPTA